ncbi:tetratricopeptide repeat protein, partial [bacterium]|nr:tetratricopeptide repeat protein [bacterium]MBU1025099.1 tetratricopeptide repeat protein [bacterium]
MIPLFKNHCLFFIIFIILISFSCRNDEKRKIDSFDAFNLGVQAVKSENLDLAKYYFQRATLLNPDFVEARLNLANAQFLTGNLNDARELYSTLISEKQFDPRLLFNLGWIYMIQEDYETANGLFLKSRKADPEFYDSDYGLANLALVRDQPVLARFYLEKYLLDVPDGRWTPKANEILASLPTDVSESLKILDDSAISIKPDNQTNNPEPAATAPVDEITPEKTKPVNEKVPVKNDSENNKTKKTQTVTPPPVVVPETPKKPAPEKKTVAELIADGKIALKNGDFSVAEKCFKEARLLDSKVEEIPLNLAKIYFNKNNLSDEKKYLREYLQLGGKNK